MNGRSGHQNLKGVPHFFTLVAEKSDSQINGSTLTLPLSHRRLSRHSPFVPLRRRTQGVRAQDERPSNGFLLCHGPFVVNLSNHERTCDTVSRRRGFCGVLGHPVADEQRVIHKEAIPSPSFIIHAFSDKRSQDIEPRPSGDQGNISAPLHFRQGRRKHKGISQSSRPDNQNPHASGLYDKILVQSRGCP